MKQETKRYHSLKIRTQILLLYLSVFIFALFLTISIFSYVSEKKTEEEVGNAAMQTVSALKGNLGYIFEGVSQFSNLIYFDPNIQSSLRKSNTAGINAQVQQNIQKSIINMLLSGNYISSVFIFDNHNKYYYTNKFGPILVDKDAINHTKWYKRVEQSNGQLFYIHKSEGVISYPTREDKNYICLIRNIVDVETYEQLAVLMITIDEETIQSYFNEVGEKYNSQFYIIDSKGNYIIKPSNYDKNMDSYVLHNTSDVLKKKGYEAVNVGDERVTIVQKDLGIEDWTLVGAIPGGENARKVYANGFWIVILFSLNLLFVLICSISLTKLIFTPLYRMQKHMKLIEDGYFIEIPLENTRKNEINDLKNVFNQMVISIKDLIEKVKKEEKIIAKNELDLIQAQINPHFLYNTLDAVSALALLEDHENCFKMTQALGSFYRNSLNNGKDLVTIREELECIESYITILNIRYDNKINLQFDVEDTIQDYKILKLILQPIVENAAHHGIRSKKGMGTIRIKGYQDEDEVIFIIEDDGLGMTEDKIAKILEGKTKEGKSGFGLYSSIQRISLYYGIEKPIMIVSEVGCGTEITIRIKVIKGVGGYENEDFIGR